MATTQRIDGSSKALIRLIVRRTARVTVHRSSKCVRLASRSKICGACYGKCSGRIDDIVQYDLQHTHQITSSTPSLWTLSEIDCTVFPVIPYYIPAFAYHSDRCCFSKCTVDVESQQIKRRFVHLSRKLKLMQKHLPLVGVQWSAHFCVQRPSEGQLGNILAFDKVSAQETILIGLLFTVERRALYDAELRILQ